MSLIAMAFLWTGSQIPLYIFGMEQPLTIEYMLRAKKCGLGGIPPLIYRYFNPTDYAHNVAN